MANFELQYGNIVPSGGINLAHITPPSLDPVENVVIMNAARNIPLNKELYYSDPIATDIEAITFTHTTTSTLTSSLQAKDLSQQIYHLHSPIKLLGTIEDASNAWHLEIQDGTFTVLTTYTSSNESYVDSDGNTIKSWLLRASEDDSAWTDGEQLVLIYSIPEVLTSPYLTGIVNNTEKEYNIRALQVVNEVAAIGDEHTILLNNRNIYQIDSIYVNQEPLLIETFYSTSIDQAIKSTDFENGTITLTRSITNRDTIQVSYRYSQKALLYRGYFDEDRNIYHDLDLNPSYGHTFSNGEPGWKLLSEVVYLYLLPSAAYSYTNYLATGNIAIHSALKYTQNLLRWEAGPSLTLGSTGYNIYTPPGGTDISLSSSTYGYCWYNVSRFASRLPFDTPQVILIDGSIGEGLTAGGYGTLSGNPNAAILAKIYVTPNGIVDSISMIDTRRYGGGVLEDSELQKQLVTGEQQREMATCWDIGGWEGDPAMLNGVVVIELPEQLLTGEDGYTEFTEREIEEIVSKHVAAGIKPIIKYVRS